MPLLLRIENVDRLPDGGPLFVEVFGRGLDLGRDQHLDWTLPDPSRFISGKHCEIRYRNGEYVLTDVSTNGTFLAGSDQRVQSPYRLRDGDRLAIGHYIVSVAIRDEAAAEREEVAASAAPAGRMDPWDVAGEAAPVPASAFRAHAATPRSDPLDWIADIPAPSSSPPAWSAPPPPPVSPPPADAWMGPAPAAPTFPDTSAPAPAPRRPAPPVAPAAPAADDWMDAGAPSDPFPRGPMPPTPIPVPMPGEPVPPMPPGPVPPMPVPLPPDPLPTPGGPGGSGDASGAALLARIARAAGIPPDVVERRPPEELADEIGRVLGLATENLRRMLAARAETKSLVRSSSHTVIRAFDNNPLKFTPSSEEALRIMFGPPSRNYLAAAPAVEQGFSDLKRHQAQTYAAMQRALEKLLCDLAPGAVEEGSGSDKGIGGLVGSRKARFWDTYATRWRTLSGREDERLTEAFMRLFAESYDALQGEGR